MISEDVENNEEVLLLIESEEGSDKVYS